MTNTKTGRTSGFTMVELLIAVIIIGILVTIIVPVLSNRAADARLAAAKADMEALANAESQVAIDTGYVVRLHVLNDSGAVGDNLGSEDINDVIDSIRDEEFNGSASSPDLIFLDAKTGALMPNTLYQRAKNDPEAFGWRGPYVNFQRKLQGPPAPAPVIPWTIGSPLDPWGNPYFLFVAGTEDSSGGSATGGWLDEQSVAFNAAPKAVFDYIPGYSVTATQFDRMTLLSLGPNGLPGDGVGTPILGTDDDLVRAF